VILASHDMPSILRLCDRAVLLERGRVVRSGDPLDVVNAYYERHGAGSALAPTSASAPVDEATDVTAVPADAAIRSAIEGRRGTGEVSIVGLRLAAPEGNATRQARKGGRVRLEIWATAHRDVDDLTFGFQMTDRMNTVIFGQTIYLKDRAVLQARAGDELRVTFDVDLTIESGQYVFEVVATDCRIDLPNVVYDRLPRALVLDVLDAPERTAHGLVELRTEYSVQRWRPGP
jgi:lipopolysaccharide transport system ATP-binding protein